MFRMRAKAICDLLLRGSDGAIAAEYGVLVAFVVLVIMVGVGAYGNALETFIWRLAVDIRTVLGA